MSLAIMIIEGAMIEVPVYSYRVVAFLFYLSTGL